MKKRCVTLPEPTGQASGELESLVMRVLQEQNAVATPAEKQLFSSQVVEATRSRNLVRYHWSNIEDADDIITLILRARNNGEIVEAIWRCFLAAHFGRPSARDAEQIQSAAKMLRAFCDQPFWTWERISCNLVAFESWLYECTEKLQTLRFGKHRKYESSKPDSVFETIKSFVSLAERFGSPKRLLSLNDLELNNGFDVIYGRLSSVVRFGRTARYDFLLLLNDLGLSPHEPSCCYLAGATGPLKGAIKLWGDYNPKQLDEFANQLCNALQLSPAIIEDAICNWQK